MVTKPSPKPHWGYSPRGYNFPDNSLSNAQIKQLAGILRSSPSGLGENKPTGLTRLLTKLSHDVETFKYTMESSATKNTPGQNLPKDEVLAAIGVLKGQIGQLRETLSSLDHFSRAAIYANDPTRHHRDLGLISRLHDDVLVAERKLTRHPLAEELGLSDFSPELNKQTKKGGTPISRIGRFVAWKLIDIYEHSPDDLFEPPRRTFINSRKSGKDDGPCFVWVALKIFLPGISNAQVRTALRYAVNDKHGANKSG